MDYCKILCRHSHIPKGMNYSIIASIITVNNKSYSLSSYKPAKDKSLTVTEWFTNNSCFRLFWLQSVFNLLKEVQNTSFWTWHGKTCQVVNGFWLSTQQRIVNQNYNAYGSSKRIIALVSLFWIILYLSCLSAK